MVESSLYERLGGAFAIAAVIDHFSDAVVQNVSGPGDCRESAMLAVRSEWTVSAPAAKVIQASTQYEEE